MIKPITPDEVTSLKAKLMPGIVFDCWNKLIAENWDGQQSVVLQKDIVSILMNKMDYDRGTINEKGYLDIEPIYREYGWSVIYDKPAYDESYDAHFIFRKKK